MLMRKIHPGFIAIAILLGPATLILAHEKITRTPAQEVFESFDPPPILRQAYTRCAEAPKQQRSAAVRRVCQLLRAMRYSKE